jgi:hypothetical protein
MNAGPQLKCVHCQHEFDSNKVKARLGLVTYDYETARWTEALR